jgi:3-isopropylmalate dehydratase small subunit
VPVETVKGTKIDSAFVGSCTNGRMEDMRAVADVLRGRKVAPGVVLKIVPATDEIWNLCLKEGLVGIFKKAGALLGNAGCAGCAAGQIGQNGPGEVTVSTGNRNFAGKQGKGDVYLASPDTVAASAVAGFITTADDIPGEPAVFERGVREREPGRSGRRPAAGPSAADPGAEKPTVLEGRVWIIDRDDVDTDMIFHNRYLTITDIGEMGKYALDNLEGWEDFARKAEPGDIIVTGKNFGAGSSRQQAVDCFKALGVRMILAESFGAIYERNAINAGFPILAYKDLGGLGLKQRDRIRVDLVAGTVTNPANGKTVPVAKFSPVQLEIYRRGDLLA